MLQRGNPQVIDVECDGNRCPRNNKVVCPELVGCGDEIVGLLGEAPYEEEEKYGRPFIGRSGLVLRKYLDLDNYRYLIFNSMQCLSRRDNDLSIKPSEMSNEEVEERLHRCSLIRDAMIDFLPEDGTLVLFGKFAKRAILDEPRHYDVSTKPNWFLINCKMLEVYVNYHPAYTIYRRSSITEFEDVLRATGKFKIE